MGTAGSKVVGLRSFEAGLRHFFARAADRADRHPKRKKSLSALETVGLRRFGAISLVCGAGLRENNLEVIFAQTASAS